MLRITGKIASWSPIRIPLPHKLKEPRQADACKSRCGTIWPFRVTIQNEFPCHTTWSTRKSTLECWKRFCQPSPEPTIPLISPYLLTSLPVIHHARSVSGKPSTNRPRIHYTNMSRSAIPSVVLIYMKRKRRWRRMTRNGNDFQPRPLKRLFTSNQCWTSFLNAGGLRDIEVEAVTKMLAWGTRIRQKRSHSCWK